MFKEDHQGTTLFNHHIYFLQVFSIASAMLTGTPLRPTRWFNSGLLTNSRHS